ncbi:MAG: site-2 protease family protein [Actinomycetota bacterium]
MNDLLFAIYLLIWLIPSLTLHEFGHAYVADRLGDRTARNAGRLTLNPIPHIDPFGTVILPGLLLLLVAFGRGSGFPVFAFAKPTPFNPNNFKDPAKGTMWTAFAGPLVNLVLAVIAAVVFRVIRGTGTSQLGIFFGAGLIINVILFVFNLMPIPGLDGSRVLARFLPPRAREIYRGLDQYLALFILLIFFLFPGPIFAIVRGLGNGLCGILVGADCI